MDRSYQPVLLSYPNLNLVHDIPPIYVIENFFSAEECLKLIRGSEPYLIPSPVVGEGNGETSPMRTSSTCFLKRESVPGIIERVSKLLLGKNLLHIELPQVGKYLPTQEYKVGIL